MTKIISLAKKICSFGERQDKNLQLAITFIEKFLLKNDISYVISKYNVVVPKFIKSELKVDKKIINCSPSGLTSGKITTKKIINNLIEQKKEQKNINFNPLCKEISRMNFYKKAALTIKRDDVQKIKNSKKIDAILIVKKKKEIRKQILIGNLKNPQTIIFTHLDSLGGESATDNAISNALILEIVRNNKNILNNCLFVYDSCEELSLNDNIY
ncbi:MAG: hypothetical protein WC755_05545 [Candidatus Woesearchaeota archaeon]|jgi:hypothetical protein